MNFEVVNFISKVFSLPANRKGFVNFVWWAGVVSITLGVIALVVSLSVLDGFHDAIEENAVRFTSHIKVYAFNRQPIKDHELIVQKILDQVKGVEGVFPSVSKEVLLRTKSFVEGVSLQSINPKSIENLRKIEIGSNKVNTFNFEGILVGKMLAERLGLSIGDSIILVSINVLDTFQLPQANVVKVKIDGMYESGMAKYDDVFVYASENVFKKLLADTSSFVNSLDVYVKDISNVDSISQQIESIIGYPFYCFTFYDLNSSIFAWIELQKEPIPIVLSLITIVAIFNVVTFLLVNIVEKTKSIGIFATLGLTTREIALVFLRLGLGISFIGLSLGLIISLLFSLLQKYFRIIQLDPKVYFFNVLPITISFDNYLLVIVFTLVLTFFISLIPSYIASKIKPVNAIRFIK